MIELQRKTFPELRESRRFDFRAILDASVNNRLSVRTHGEHMEQFCAVDRIRLTVERLKDLPCTAEIQVGLHEGYTIMRGTVEACDDYAFACADVLISQIKTEVENFVQRWPYSSFSITAHQQLEFVNIER